MPGMLPPKAQPKRSKRGTVCRTQTTCKAPSAHTLKARHCVPSSNDHARHQVFLPKVQPKRSKQGLRAELQRPCKAPSARYAAAKSAPQTIKARHCVPSLNDDARHHVPSSASCRPETQSQDGHARRQTPSIAAAQSAAQMTKARHCVRSPNVHTRHRAPGMLPPEMQPKQSKRGPVCQARTTIQATKCQLLLPPKAQPKRSKRGTVCRVQTFVHGLVPSIVAARGGSNAHSRHHMPSIAAAQSAAQTIKARHCVPISNVHARPTYQVLLPPARARHQVPGTLLPKAQPKRSKRGTACQAQMITQEAPSAKYAAAKSAARMIKARHCVLSPIDHARHHVPSIAAAQSAAKTIRARHCVRSPNDRARHQVPGTLLPKAQPKRSKRGTACQAQMIMQGTKCQVCCR